MISGPWAIVLTVVFAATGGYCAWSWLSRVVSGGKNRPAALPEVATDLNHAVMSLLMITMIWPTLVSGTVGLQVQSVIFGLFAVTQTALAIRSPNRGARLDYVSNVVLNLAMIWMLLAMPWLMGASGSGDDGGAHAEHGGSGAGAAGEAMVAPSWVEPVNFIVIGLSFAVAAWWVWRGIRGSPGHRLHAACHALCGLGMGTMLVLM